MSPRSYVQVGRAILLPILFAMIAAPVAPAFGQGCASVLDDAKEQYTYGRFEEAIALLSSCVEDQNGDPSVRQEAYRVMGMAYVAMSMEMEAKITIQNLLDLVPAYEPDPENDRPGYVELVRELKRESDPNYVAPGEQVEGGGIPKKIIAGGVAVVGAILYFLIKKDDPDPVLMLPDPPVLPSK